MVDRVVREYAIEALYLVHHGDARWKAADDAFRLAAAAGEPLLLLGTTLLFMAYFERLRIMDVSIQLPAGTRVMDTGGAKGTDRGVLPRGRGAGIRGSDGHSQTTWSMSTGGEMGSQVYDDCLVAVPRGTRSTAGSKFPHGCAPAFLTPRPQRAPRRRAGF